MFKIFGEEQFITVCMFATMILSMVGKVILGVVYQNMINEAENMSATKNKVLKQCKSKYTNCYQLNKGVANVPVFVDKCLSRIKIGSLRLQTLYHLSGQMMLLSVVCAGVGICKSIAQGRSLGDVLPFYIVSLAGLYLYFAISAITDVNGRREVLKTNVVDFLENHMTGRLEHSIQDGEENVGKEQGKRHKTSIELMPVKTVERKTESAIISKTFSLSEERELAELLKEFLTS